LIKTLSRMFENRIVKLVWRPYMKVSNHLAILVNFMSILKMTSWWQVLFSSPKLSNGILNASFTWRAESEQWHPEGKFYTATDKCQSLSHLILHWLKSKAIGNRSNLDRMTWNFFWWPLRSFGSTWCTFWLDLKSLCTVKKIMKN
jgi:hypothetical protein